MGHGGARLNGLTGGCLGVANLSHPFTLSSPPKRSEERGPRGTLRHKVPDRLSPSGMTSILWVDIFDWLFKIGIQISGLRWNDRCI